MAAALQRQGVRALLLDKNRRNVNTARRQGLEAHHGDALSESIWDEVDLTGIGRLLALTPNSEVNSLAALHFQELFSREDMYQLPLSNGSNGHSHTPQHLRGRFLFAAETHYRYLANQLNSGATIEERLLTEDHNYLAYQAEKGNQLLPLFLINERKELFIYTTDYQPIPRPGQTLISLASTNGA
jgi:hypothetical protein